MKLFFALLGTWLLLEQSLAPADVLVGAVVALGGTLAFARLRMLRGALRCRPRAAAELLALLLFDVVLSNAQVAIIVLGLRRGKRTAGFLCMPLEVRHPAALACIAGIITATPGTSWARYDAARNALTIHVLDLVDEAAWIRDFKTRYERRLLEIFP